MGEKGDINVNSPWLVTPTLSSDPKLGTSVGAVVGYLVKLDNESPTSMFGAAGSYSATGSQVGGLFARAYLAGDQHRISGFVGGGIVENDYSDFLGSGIPVSTTDHLKILAFRYLRQIKKNWYFGVQLIDTNYLIAGDDVFSQTVLEHIGLLGFDSVALGLVGQYDSRDNQNSPREGMFFTVNNNAYRESFGGNEDFDAYVGDIRFYHLQSKEFVLATKISGRWTDGAPRAGFSSVNLRGYVRGQYLAKHVTSIELDERIPLSGAWGASLYLGLAGSYNDLADQNESKNWYPAVAAGIGYQIKPAEKMVVKLDFAIGKDNNHGAYFSFGHPF